MFHPKKASETKLYQPVTVSFTSSKTIVQIEKNGELNKLIDN